MLAGGLEFCECGHVRGEHRPGRGCWHVNQPSRRHPERARCHCPRFRRDERVDGEAFVRKVLEKVLRRDPIDVEPCEREEAVAFLLAQLWIVSEHYDSRSHIRFGVFAYTSLWQDAYDHFRKVRGRHGQHRVVDTRGFVDGDLGVDPVADRASGDPGDDPDGWGADGGGLLAVGDRPAARLFGGGGGSPVGPDAPVAGGGGAGEGGRAGGPVAGAAVGAWFVDCAGCGWRSYLEPPNGLPGWHRPASCVSCGAPL